jgi:redox-sensitive bicupin YhaK (pirin superfamily)
MPDLLPDGALEVVVVPSSHDLGDNFTVRRVLPSRQRRMVGPFVFLDEMGPHVFAPGKGLDVRPHPHIGLATVTYLFSGEILHRDSIGSVQAIRPGDVNWMTAGRGIVHSERSAPEARLQASTLAGLQCWVALPAADQECAPAFVHTGVAELPFIEADGVSARIVAGSFMGHTSPVRTSSPLFFVDLHLTAGAVAQVAPDYTERAIYVVEGALDLGADGVFGAGQLLVLKPGKPIAMTGADGAARAVLLGGEPMAEPRYLSWNFVSSSAERIEQARQDWRDQRFDPVPGETEFIPLPDIPGKPVRYP